MKGPLAALGLSLLLAGCVTDAPATQDKYVGQTRWVREGKGVMVCPKVHTFGLHAPECFSYNSGAFTLEHAVAGKYGGVDAYFVRTADGREGFVYHLDAIFADDVATRKSKLAAKADCERRGGVAVGMTRAQVYASCWGKPERINTTTTAGGDHEQLVYGYNYVYIRNGVVTSIQTSRR